MPAAVEAALVGDGGREVLWDYWMSVAPELAEAVQAFFQKREPNFDALD